jgi:hypothetical protein
MEQNDEQRAGESSPRRTRRLPEDWRLLIEAQASAGLGVEEYCRQQRLTPSCFYRWRRFLAGTGGGTSPWANQRRRSLPAIAGFAAVRVASDQSKPQSLPGESIRLRLAGGRELILPVSMPASRLVELLIGLESPPRERGV